jgi:hypothetical protein
VSASSCWPTATANDWKGSSRPGQRRGQLSEAAEQLWPTPQSRDCKGQRGAHTKSGRDLTKDAQLWPTPSATLVQDRENPETWLARQAKLREEYRAKDWRPPAMPLTIAAKLWPTPTAGDCKSAGSRNTATSKAKPGVSLTDAATTGDSFGRASRPLATTPKDGSAGSQQDCPRPRLLLNPEFVEALMGFPIGWTALPGASRRDRLRCLGNAVVSQQGVMALTLLGRNAMEEGPTT